MSKKKGTLDHRRKYTMILDCETATLPYPNLHDLSSKQQQIISIGKPLIYDLGWTIADNKGKVYRKRNFLISEIFSVPLIFDTAYYKEKKPFYLDKLSCGEIELKPWREATAILEEDLKEVSAVTAYNAMFDFKKAIPFTELYINNLYSADYEAWLKMQLIICEEMITGKRKTKEQNFEPDVFRFRGVAYPLFDLWGLACTYILNCDEYRLMCRKNGWITDSGKFYKTSAETTFRFIENETDFQEAHTALDDAEIETKIFAQIVKKSKGKFEKGIIYFPFRLVGRYDEEEEG